MHMIHSTPRTPHRQGFTLLEVLMAVAVIGILVAIIIPAIGGAQTSARRAKTRVQFSQWSAAIEQFRQEYGYYPTFAEDRVNGGPPGALLAEVHIFHDTLTSRRRNGDALPTGGTTPAPQVQNPKRIAFVSFGTGDLSTDGLIQDAFGNTQIGVLLDRNLDTNIDLTAGGGDYATSPLLTVANAQGSAVTVTTPPGNRIRAGVAFYSAGDGQTPVTSW
ncbi:MAG: prepilin-type N-terminal cleavage/methylation domain-containing protein [Opitutaceae bacterium]|nr:prepilin-type N-terminal cleavage/methylation domain-containing protein [Opitutaceae bacterium]